MLRAWFNSIQSIFSAAIDFLNFPNVGFNILAKMRITTLLFKFDWKSQRIKIDCLVVVGTEMLERTDESSIRFYKSGWHRKWRKKIEKLLSFCLIPPLLSENHIFVMWLPFSSHLTQFGQRSPTTFMTTVVVFFRYTKMFENSVK